MVTIPSAHDYDRRRYAPIGHQGQWNGAGKYPDRVAQKSGDQEDGRGEPASPHPEPGLEPGVGGLLVTPEISGQEEAGYGDPADEIAEGELQECQVAAGADARNRDDGEGRGLGRDDGEENSPGGQVPGTEKIIGGAALPPRHPESQPEGEDEIESDNDEVGVPHTGERWAVSSEQ
jgi:hypothetical protein